MFLWLIQWSQKRKDDSLEFTTSRKTCLFVALNICFWSWGYVNHFTVCQFKRNSHAVVLRENFYTQTLTTGTKFYPLFIPILCNTVGGRKLRSIYQHKQEVFEWIWIDSYPNVFLGRLALPQHRSDLLVNFLAVIILYCLHKSTAAHFPQSMLHDVSISDTPHCVCLLCWVPVWQSERNRLKTHNHDNLNIPIHSNGKCYVCNTVVLWQKLESKQD